MREFKNLVSKYANTSNDGSPRALKRSRRQQEDEDWSSSSTAGSQPTTTDNNDEDMDADINGDNDVDQGGAKKMVKREEFNHEDSQTTSASPVLRRSSSRLASTSSRVITPDTIKTNPYCQNSSRSVATSSKTTVSNGTSVTYTISDDDESKDSVKVEETITVKTERQQSRRKATNFVNGYTPPEVYAHLDFVPDHIGYDLDVLFVGINPGVRTSEMGHHYSGPSNHFWPCLNESGLLPAGVRVGPKDDHTLPARFNLGLTNLVDRPSRSGAELSNTEARAAAPILMAKIKKYRPRFVCFVSKQAWDMFCGVGLGLQTGFVSWDEEDDHFDRLVQGEEARPSFKNKAVSTAKKERGTEPYRLAPFFTKGPALDRLNQELEKEGVPVHFNVVKDDDEDVKPVKKEEEQDVKPTIKEENMDETKPNIKKEESFGESSSTSANTQSRRPVFRGSRMFVMPSTSGRVTQYRKEDKLAFFRQLAELVYRDRLDRGLKPIGSLQQ
ncbi:hypothetical protein BGW41_006046 [Actinomortierella wolfii]|nr:hypothetical protein BGW41_006046 [Actinomortierella wolfii]